MLLVWRNWQLSPFHPVHYKFSHTPRGEHQGAGGTGRATRSQSREGEKGVESPPHLGNSVISSPPKTLLLTGVETILPDLAESLRIQNHFK